MICADATFIVLPDNKVLEPVTGLELLNGFHEDDQVTIGYEYMRPGRVSCGADETVKLLCVEKK